MNASSKKNIPDYPGPHDALILVDIQNDFLPGGSLAVPDGNEILPVINKYIKLFQAENLPVVATRDWHPPDHCSFKKSGGIWPEHCIAGTEGAQFSNELELPSNTLIISKATESNNEAYSGLDHTELDAQLKKRDIKQVWVGGLATDYCVLNTVKDFLHLSYTVILLSDAIKAVNVRPDDGARAEKEMIDNGAVPLTLKEVKNIIS